MYGRPLPSEDRKWEKKHIPWAMFLVLLILIPAVLDLQIGGLGKFPLSWTRLLSGTSVPDDLTKKQVESRLANILMRDNEGATRRPSRETASFDGCVLVHRVERPKSQCTSQRWWVTDRRIDLRYLKTHPLDVNVGPVSEDRLSSFVGRELRYDYRVGISKRLSILSFHARGINWAEAVKNRNDQGRRRRNVSSRFNTELQDRIYLDAGDTEHWCVGEKTHSPTRETHQYRFVVDRARTEEFVDLIHHYRQNHCSVEVGG